MPGYQWFKVYTTGWLEGSIRDNLTAEMRGIFIDILALASRMRKRDGTLRYAEGKPMPRSHIAAILRIPEEKLDECIEICSQDKNENDDKHRIEVWEDGTIEVSNFGRYQSVPVGQEGSGDAGKDKAPGKVEDKYIKGKLGELVQR